jgi:two-component system, NarL family, nitrate/nitrite response regulator NarL
VGGDATAAPGTPVSVSIVDDHPVVLEGVQAWLAEDPSIQVKHAVAGLGPDAFGVDVLVMDLNLGGRLITDRIGELARDGQRIVAFSQFTEQSLVLDVLDAGAGAYVCKNEGRAHLLQAVLAVAADRPYVTPTAAGVLAGDRRPDAPRLSARERLALLLWFQSMSKASAARRMGVSPHTVEMYIKRARLKYAQVGRLAPTKADMLLRAIEDGLVRPEEVGEYRSRAAKSGR